jgi:hypothetical protein
MSLRVPKSPEVDMNESENAFSTFEERRALVLQKLSERTGGASPARQCYIWLTCTARAFGLESKVDRPMLPLFQP